VARTERPVRGPLTYTLWDDLRAKKQAQRHLNTIERMLLSFIESEGG
jgi:hypothetical protein